MKVLVLLSLVSLCASIPTYFERPLNVGEDGTNTFINTNGDTMDILGSRYSTFQADILEAIRQYQSAVGDKSYNSHVTPLQRAVGESNGLEGFENLLLVKEDSRNFNSDMSIISRSLLQMTPEFKVGQQEESLPIKDTVYQTYGDSYGHDLAYLKDRYQTEQLPIVQRLQQWTVQQKMVNVKVDQLIKQSTSSQELKYHQRMLNQEAQDIIIELTYKQALINRQIEQLVGQRQVVPQVLVAEQRFVYQQVQYMLEQLVYQKAFIIDRFHRIFASGRTLEHEYLIQHKIVYQQVQQLIQQVLVQQNYLRQQIQVVVQVGAVAPQELVLFQKMTYQQVELYIQSLIKELVHQQAYFKDLFQVFVQNQQPIPQELVPQQTMICIELSQLIRSADYVPQDLVDKEQRLHYEIILLLEEAHALSQKTVSQWAPQRYQWLPQQWVPINARQTEYMQPREMFIY